MDIIYKNVLIWVEFIFRKVRGKKWHLASAVWLKNRKEEICLFLNSYKIYHQIQIKKFWMLPPRSRFILSRFVRCGYKTGYGLVNENLYTPLGTTSNYRDIAIFTLYKSPQHTQRFSPACHVFTCCSLPTAFVGGDSSVSYAQVLLS
jgi:hypothetical protein